MCKTDLFYQNKHDYQLFSIFLVMFLRKHKIRSFECTFGALSEALKVALLRAMAIQSACSDDSFK